MRTGRRRVLVVDDDAAIRLVCRINLAAAGIEVVEAESGERAFELVRMEKPDLILLDVMMPGADGWTVARQLKEDPATADVPVVFLTARAGREDRIHGHGLGAVGYVTKPFDPIALVSLLDETLHRLERGERTQLEREVLGE